MTWTSIGSKKAGAVEVVSIGSLPPCAAQVQVFMRQDKAVLGKISFDITHHEPKLTKEKRAEQIRSLQHQLYAVFRDMKEKQDDDMDGNYHDSMI